MRDGDIALFFLSFLSYCRGGLAPFRFLIYFYYPDLINLAFSNHYLLHEKRQIIEQQNPFQFCVEILHKYFELHPILLILYIIILY